MVVMIGKTNGPEAHIQNPHIRMGPSHPNSMKTCSKSQHTLSISAAPEFFAGDAGAPNQQQNTSSKETSMEEGVKRWVVDISKWDPLPHQFSVALSLLPPQQHSSVTRYPLFLSQSLVSFDQYSSCICLTQQVF